MPYVTFVNNGGRTGNNIFQYLAAKLIEIKYGHVYIPFKDFLEGATIQDSDYDKDLSCYSTMNIICKGYFQKSDYFIPYRDQLLDAIKDCDDCWFDDSGNKIMIRDFFQNPQAILPHPKLGCDKESSNNHLCDDDVVISLRLDDFIQCPCPTSDILPPHYYLNILENIMCMGGRLIIVSDNLRWDWEHKYVEFFKKWDPIFVHGDLLTDFALMRDCPILLHSNSTFCWLASFFSQKKEKLRYIPNTHFYVGQSLNQITKSDVLYDVSPLHHHDVYQLDIRNYLRKYIFPLPYCVPDECVAGNQGSPVRPRLKDENILIFDNMENPNFETKKYDICPLIPGERTDHLFVAGQESEYYQMYQQSWFAHTKKKGGWDCLRHYEILANGCIPIFENLDDCPDQSLTTFPKHLLKDVHVDLDEDERQKVIHQLLEHTREHCTTSANIQYVLRTIQKTPKNVLLIVGNCGVNYTREFFWIGMKRYIQSVGGVAVEYPKMDYLYEDYPTDKKSELHGNGFTYTGRLQDDYNYDEQELIEKIKDECFDLIVYGKVGPDEGDEGSLPNLPLWEHVFKRYSRDEIVCLYGGDECIDLTSDTIYSKHIYTMSQYATCFVRELRM